LDIAILILYYFYVCEESVSSFLYNTMSIIAMKMVYRATACLTLCLLVCGLGVCGSEFVKKTPARIQRKQAQQRDILIERCAKLLDALILGCMSLHQSCAAATAEWYDLLKSLATTESCCLETASIESFKEYVASLEEVALLKQKLEQALQASVEKRTALNKVCVYNG
jgi:hypothetical protein